MADPTEPPSPSTSAAVSLVRRGDGYLLIAPRAIPGWEPRRFRRPVLLVAGARFYIADARSSGRSAEYVFAPWPADAVDDPVAEIALDGDFVRALEEAARAEVRTRGSEALRAVLKPLIGFLPSTMKLRMHLRGGVHPTEATRLSVFAEYLVVLIGFVVQGITTITGVFSSDLLWTLWLVVGIDAFVRYHEILGDDFSPPGFYEWTIPRRRR